MLVFAKSATADLTAEEIKRLVALAAALKAQFGVEG